MVQTVEHAQRVDAQEAMSPVVAVVSDTTRDLTAVLWAARYAAATTGRLHLLHLQPVGPRGNETGHDRDNMLDLQRAVSRVAPSMEVTWDLTWRSPGRGQIGLPGSAGLLVVAWWGDGRPFTVPSATSTVVVVPESSRGDASGVVVVVDPDRENTHVLAAAHDVATALATSLLVVLPTQASRASRNAELLVIGSDSLHLPGANLSALSWSTRRAVAVVPDGSVTTFTTRTGPPVAVGGAPGL